MRQQTLPPSIQAELANWCSHDLPPKPYRHRHPYLSRVERVLRWICSNYELTTWKDIRPSQVQAFVRAHDHLKPASLQSYVKGLRRWLRWHERDDFGAPIISTRLTGICPPVETDDPFVVEDSVWRYLLHRSRWVYAGSTALWCHIGGRHRVASMNHWRRGGFYLWLTLGSQLGLRPWELAFLRVDEIHLTPATVNGKQPPPHVALLNHQARARKTPLAGTKLLLQPGLVNELAAYLDNDLPGGMLFAVKNSSWPSGWQPPHYDQIWRALREETGLPLNGYIVRRRHATRTVGNASSLFDAIRATRHARIETLLKHYVQRHGGRVVDPATGRLIDDA